MSKKLLMLSSTVLAVCLLIVSSATAQPCYTCRTEKCPTDKTMPEWCGKKGADPLQRVQKPKLQPSSVTGISIISDPVGASVHRDSADGELLGETPLTGLTLTPGRHRFVLQRDGHEPGLLEVDARKPNERFALSLRKQESQQTASPIGHPIAENQEPARVTETATGPSTPPIQTPTVDLQSTPLSSPQSPAATPTVSTPAEPHRTRRKVIIAAVFGGVAVAALGAGAAFAALTHNPSSRIISMDSGSNGQPARQCVVDGQPYECYLNLAPAYGVAFGVAAISTIGMGVTLGLK